MRNHGSFFYPLLVGAVWAALGACNGRDANPLHSPAAAPVPSTDPKPSAPLPQLTVGIQVSPAMALVMVAEDKGFFEKAGLDVSIKEFTAGKFALQAFLGGSLDVAVSGEVPVALSMLQGNRFRILGQVVERTVNEVRVVARSDGTSDPARYFAAKKRKLATSFGGGPEFFTYNFLKKYGIAADQVEIISQKPEDMPAALLSGTVDAISIFDPFAFIAESKMGSQGTTFKAGDIYSELYVIDVSEATIDKKRGELSAFLRGLMDASGYAAEHPGDAQAIVSKYTKLDPATVAGVWSSFVFKPALTPQFVEYTTAQAKWAIAKGTFPKETAIPDYAAAVYPDLLAEISPGAVKLAQK